MAIKKNQLYASLWAGCDELSGGMDASLYKDYVLTEGHHIFLIDRFGRSSLWIACEKLKGIGSDTHGLFAHGQKSFGGR